MSNHSDAKIRSDNSSGYKGVSWNKGRKTWQAYINVGGVHCYLGKFTDVESAARAFQVALADKERLGIKPAPHVVTEYQRKWLESNKERTRRYSGNWREANRDYIRQKAREQIRQIRLEVIRAYGGHCVCCGEDTMEFLSIDHVNNDGAQERRAIGSGPNFYRSLKKRGFPRDGYRLLCLNCNLSRGFFGYCPHERQIQHLTAVA